MAPSKNSVALEVQMSRGPLPAVEPVNFFHFSVSGPEIEMRMGMIDIFAMGTIANKAKEMSKRGQMAAPAKLTVDITHRIFLSPRGFLHLHHKVNEMAGLMQDLGLIENATEKAEG